MILGGLAAGAVSGLLLTQVGAVDPVGEPTTAVARLDAVEVLACPGTGPVGLLARGDRVVATGRSDDAAWVEIRSPLSVAARAWVRAAAFRGDPLAGDVDDLPVHTCSAVATTTAPPVETTTSSTTSTSSTTTSTSSTTSTTLEPTTTAPPTTAPPVTTTVPPTTTSTPPTTSSSTTSSSTTPPTTGGAP